MEPDDLDGIAEGDLTGSCLRSRSSGVRRCDPFDVAKHLTSERLKSKLDLR